MRQTVGDIGADRLKQHLLLHAKQRSAGGKHGFLGQIDAGPRPAKIVEHHLKRQIQRRLLYRRTATDNGRGWRVIQQRAPVQIVRSKRDHRPQPRDRLRHIFIRSREQRSVLFQKVRIAVGIYKRVGKGFRPHRHCDCHRCDGCRRCQNTPQSRHRLLLVICLCRVLASPCIRPDDFYGAIVARVGSLRRRPQ